MLKSPPDQTIWAVIVGVVTAIVLAVGRYGVIERTSLLLVASFTLVTLLALVMLQFDPAWAITWPDLRSGVVAAVL